MTEAGVSPEQPKRRKRLGELLVDAGLIDQETLVQAMKAQQVQKRRIGQILMEMGAADDLAIARALAQQLRIPLVRPDEISISQGALDLVSPEIAEHYLLLPVGMENR